MPVYKNLKAIRKLSNSSLTSVIDITNLNFRSLSDANLEFLNNISYDETANSFSVYSGKFSLVEVTDTLSLTLNGIPRFTINSLGKAVGQEFLVQVGEAKRMRFTDFNDWPDVGVPGEIIYTGVQNQKPQFGEDFIGYLHGRGWVSLTDGSGSSYITLSELQTSPPVPGDPNPNQGIVWIGSPGLQTSTTPTTQTVYYTDENGQIFDLVLGGSGGGAGGGCGYVDIHHFLAGITYTVTHNLNTTNIVVQIIRTDTNELIDAYVNNYQSNTVDVTLSEETTPVKVIISAVGCTGSGTIEILSENTLTVTGASSINFIGEAVSVVDAGGGQANVIVAGSIGNKKYVGPTETLLIPENYQYWIFGDFTVDGTVNNYGEIIVANGNYNGSGSVNNLGSGSSLSVNLATGDSMQVVILALNATAGTPQTLTHSLNTRDFVYNVRESNTLITVDLVIIDDNNVSVTTTADVVSGSIVFQAKI